MKIDHLIQATPSGNTQIHAEGLQDQFNESRTHAQASGCPVFNVFHRVNLPDDEDGNKRFQIQSTYYDTKHGLPMDTDLARQKLHKFHETPALDGTVEEVHPE